MYSSIPFIPKWDNSKIQQNYLISKCIIYHLKWEKMDQTYNKILVTKNQDKSWLGNIVCEISGFQSFKDFVGFYLKHSLVYACDYWLIIATFLLKVKIFTIKGSDLKLLIKFGFW